MLFLLLICLTNVYCEESLLSQFLHGVMECDLSRRFHKSFLNITTRHCLNSKKESYLKKKLPILAINSKKLILSLQELCQRNRKSDS